MSTAIIWFRQDLRCQDNPALTAACNAHDTVIPLYIAEKNLSSLIGSAQKWWLHHSLLNLQKNLNCHGLNLYLVSGSPLAKLREIISQYQVDTIYWNHRYQPEALKEDKEIKAALAKDNIAVKSFNGNLLFEPWETKNQQGNYFKVFPPFWRQYLTKLDTLPTTPAIKKWPSCPQVSSENLDSWQLIPTKPNWASKFKTFWQPGEDGAWQRLFYFLENNLNHYQTTRDYPAEQANSMLSPHLHFGEISPQQIWQIIHSARNNKYHASSSEKFLTEIAWRDFCYHQLYYLPQLATENIKPQFNQFKWRHAQEDFKRWSQGLTGFPMVDAGMRQLWQTGFMHNRVRMISASFLVKNLLIDWRIGADWFLETLLDADLALNSFNWQWTAGSNFEACPPFRIFNPVAQGEKFDPEGDYIKEWLPELAKLPKKWLHKPWLGHNLPIKLGKDYPYPMVDLQVTREQALAEYRAIK
ncbi:cryptochrome/photolyase family protein [Legionella sp. D16C41]|uniref:cryptochrome/photolyase family protein n=1 Tax=Legionella sp. D16C41 TaxID=3402688 RepID=UPI003AF43DCF